MKCAGLSTKIYSRFYSFTHTFVGLDINNLKYDTTYKIDHTNSLVLLFLLDLSQYFTNKNAMSIDDHLIISTACLLKNFLPLLAFQNCVIIYVVTIQSTSVAFERFLSQEVM